MNAIARWLTAFLQAHTRPRTDNARRSRHHPVFAFGVVVLACISGCSDNRSTRPEASASDGAVASAKAAVDGSDGPAPSLQFDCETLMPNMTALLGTSEVLNSTYNSPAEATMPHSEQEWETKDFNSYPGTGCDWSVPTEAVDEDVNITTANVRIYPTGAWYRDHELFLTPENTKGSAWDCAPTELPSAAETSWCTTPGPAPVYYYAGDFGDALVGVSVSVDSEANTTDASSLLAAIETDLSAMTFA